METDTDMIVTTEAPRLRWVVILLYAGLALMIGAIIVTLIGALMFGFSSELRDQLFANPETAPTATNLVVASLGSTVTAVAWFVVLLMLLRIVRTVQAGDPFRETNIGRLRWMWIIIALTEIFRMFIYSASNIMMGPGEVVRTQAGVDINIGTWFLVAVIAVLAEAFRKGVELRRDQELTI